MLVRKGGQWTLSVLIAGELEQFVGDSINDVVTIAGRTAKGRRISFS